LPRARRPKLALVDGSNVAHAGEGESARLANVVLLRQKLLEEGYDPIIVVDAALRHQIDDVSGYEELVSQGVVKQAPAGTDADYFIVSFARELNAWIVSNDRFKELLKSFPDLRRRIVRYMIVAGEVVLERRGRKRKVG
jgi:Zc3h12a-like Ribonuclease NYN domain